MTTTDYTKLDNLIIAAIKAGKRQMFQIDTGSVEEEAKRRTPRQSDAWRTTERRLQALRRAGRIRYARAADPDQSGWIIVQEARDA